MQTSFNYQTPSLFYFFLAIVYTIIGVMIEGGSIPLDDYLFYHRLLVICGFIEVVISIYSLSRSSIAKNSFFQYFLGSFFVFLMSQQVLYEFGSEPPAGSIYNMASIGEIIIATAFTLVYYSGMMSGAFYYLGSHSSRFVIEYRNSDEEHLYESLTLKYAKILLYITAIPALYYIITLYRFAGTIGYDAIFENSSDLLLRASSYCEKISIVSLFAFVIFCKSKTTRIICISIIVAVVLVFFSMGERTSPTGIVLCLLWLYYKDFGNEAREGNKVRKGNRVLITTVLLIVLIASFPLIQLARSGKDGLISVYMLESAFESNGEGLFSVLLWSIGALGYSASALISTRQFVPSVVPFSYGSTYFWGITMVIPNFLSPFGITHPGAEHASLSRWLMNSMDLDYGPGFSMVAEAYMNFDWFIIPISFLIGYIFFKFLTPSISSITGRLSKYHMLICMALFLNCATMPRRELGGPLRDAVYSILPLVIMVYHGLKKHKHSTI